METLSLYFLYFFIYSIIGWCAEMIYCRLCDGKWSSRGFFFGPYCPIYGFGGLIVILLLSPFADNCLMIFLLGMIFTTTLEYITSLLMEKLFNAKWWDYSTYRFNINGRVCLLNSIEFGLLGLLLTYFIHPNIEKLVLLIPQNVIYILDIMILVILSVDLTATLNSLFNFKEKLKALNEIAEKLKENSNGKLSEFALYKELTEFRQKLLIKRSSIGKRFLEAFPNLDFKNLNVQLQEFKLDIHKYQQQLKQKRKEKKKTSI
ncbi:MAG: putative ABC transporter permease [Clostridia bacterium]|nr:putative ABC transporter permease [Clostridia bacterium]